MTPDRSELFAALAELCKKYPHWRFGQLVANVAGWSDVEAWDVEDEQLLAAALSHLKAAVSRADDDHFTPDHEDSVETVAAFH